MKTSIRAVFYACCTLIVAGLMQPMQAGTPNKLEQTTEAGYTYSYVPNDPTGMRIYTLENGIEVYLAQHTDEPVIATAIAFHTGGKNDPAENTGLSHYLEHLLFKGSTRFGTADYEKEKPYLDKISDTYDKLRDASTEDERLAIFEEIDSLSQLAAQYAIPNEYDRIVGQLGAENTNAFTSYDMTAYVNQIPTNQLQPFLRLEAERFRAPVLRLFHTELETVYEEKNRARDNENRRAYRQLSEALFPTHNYGQQTVLGRTEHLKRPDIRAIEQYYKTRYVPNNMRIFMVGDLEYTQTIEAVEQYFGDFQPKPLTEYDAPKEAPITARIEKTETGPGPENVLLGWRLPGSAHEDFPALMVLNKLLSSDAGLLSLNLNQKQRVLRSYAYINDMEDYSMLVMAGWPQQDQTLKEVEGLLIEQLDKIQQGDFDERLMESIILNEAVTEKRKQQSAYWKLYGAMMPVMQGVPYADVSRQFERLKAVTLEDVQRVGKQYLRDDNYVVIYKETGEHPDIPKIQKPAIQPLEINRDSYSEFAESVLTTDVANIEPEFIDFQEDIMRGDLKGRELLYRQNDENDLFTLYYYLDMGRLHDLEMALAARYLEYIGNEKMSAEAFKQEMFALGCDYGVAVRDKKTYVYLRGPQESFQDAHHHLRLLLSAPKADQEALDKLVKDIIKKRADRKKSKRAILYSGLANYALYGSNNPYTHRLSEDELLSMQAETLIDKLKSLLSYEHTIMYYGPTAFDAISSQLNETLEEAEMQRIPEAFDPKPQKQDQPRVLFAHYDMVQAQMMWVAPVMPWNSVMVGTMEMYEEYFSGSMHSIVFQEIRESKGLAYSAYAYLREPDRVNEDIISYAFVGTQADKVPDAIPAMQDILVNFHAAETNFKAAKAAALSQLRSHRSVRTAPFFDLMEARQMQIKAPMEKVRYEQMQGVSMEHIQRLHKAQLSDLQYTIVIIGDRNRLDMEFLESIGEFQEMDLEALFGY